MHEILQQLAEKQITKTELTAKIELDFSLIPAAIAGVSSPHASVRYGCASVLMDLSAKHPEKLYPHFEFFVSLLSNKRRILVWNGMAAIANLCRADADRKFDAIFEKYYGFIGDEYMVTVANVVGNSPRIVQAKPYLASRITKELLKVEKISTTPHLTDECKRVIAEKTVEAFSSFFSLLGGSDMIKVLAFVKAQADSPRASLRKTVECFLKRWV